MLQRAKPPAEAAGVTSGTAQSGCPGCSPVFPCRCHSELDRLKTRQERDLAPRARRAINRLAELRSERDTWLLLQSAAEHRKVGAGWELQGCGVGGDPSCKKWQSHISWVCTACSRGHGMRRAQLAHVLIWKPQVHGSRMLEALVVCSRNPTFECPSRPDHAGGGGRAGDRGSRRHHPAECRVLPADVCGGELQ